MSDGASLQNILSDVSLDHDECQRIFELRLHQLFDFATAKELHIPLDLIPSSLLEGPRDTPSTRLASTTNVDCSSIYPSTIEPSTSVFRSVSNGDHKKIHKIDKIKERLVEMLRDVGFKLSNGRLPWSTLGVDLQKKGYIIINWPQGVVRDRDKGISGLSAEDADKLHDALFVDEHRLRFIRCDGNNEAGVSMAVASGSDRRPECDRGCIPSVQRQARFRVTTAEAYPRKKRRM